MAEEQAAPVATTEAPQAPQSADDRLASAAGLQTKPEAQSKPRDEGGRFKPGPTEKPVAEQPRAAAPQAEAAEEQPEYKWDDLKSVKLKIPMKNGEKEWEEELQLEEVRNRMMMHSDYMARRREMDEQVRTSEAKQREAIEKSRTEYLTALDTMHKSILQAAAPELSNVDWAKLANDNPAEYVRLSNRAQQFNAALERVKFEQDKVRNQQAKERHEHLTKAVSESKSKLLEAVPTWNEDLYQAIQKRAVEAYGFKREEIGQVWDHRLLQVFHDAHQFRQLKETKAKTEETVKDKPPVLKPGAHKPKVDKARQDYDNARDRLRANPRSDEAAANVMRAFVTPSQR